LGESAPGWTWTDYRALADDQDRLELIEGELALAPSPNRRHQEVAFAIAANLRQRYEKAGLGRVFIAPFDMRLSEFTVPQPDVLVVSAAHEHRLTDTHLEGPCDLAVEVLSPWSRERDSRRKRAIYEDYGVGEYWIVDPDDLSALVYLHDGRRFTDPHRVTANQPLPSRLVPPPQQTLRAWAS
jgi:Uma2 family endonuclease